MLTNQIIGAGQNASSHTLRQNSPVEPVQAVTPPASGGNVQNSADQITIRPVDPNQEAQKTGSDGSERPRLELPKRVEMFIAVVDSMPDAVPESIYDARVADDTTRQPKNDTE